MFLNVWKAIDHTIILALSYFWHNFLLLIGEYLLHTVLDCKVIDPQATTSSYLEKEKQLSIKENSPRWSQSIDREN